ncbi:MAG TPA: hypothetical protein VJ577_09400 [Burkholderiaceae bacterium]|nr:hypothetical protein [Burkholderiaceae bacterium]
MTFTIAFLLLAIGIAIGYHLHPALARWRVQWRQRRYTPQMLHAWIPEADRSPDDS